MQTGCLPFRLLRVDTLLPLVHRLRRCHLRPRLQEFVREYFDQNPISTLGVIIVHEGRASKISDLSANSKRHEAAIEAAMGTTSTVRPSGDFTLQAPLEMASRTLALLPTYGTREVVVIHGTHAICDPGDINATITELQKASVRVSVISLPGEVYIASRVASATGGQYAVPEHYDGLRTALLAQCPPPPRRVEEGDQKAAMVPMGFPTLVWEKPAICACHKVLKPKGYVCPRCRSMMCDVPTTCVVCRLQLVSAAALARSYHHLFPVPLFVEVPSATEPALVPAHVLRGGAVDAAADSSTGGGDGAAAAAVGGAAAATIGSAGASASGSSVGTPGALSTGDASAAAGDTGEGGGSDYVKDASTHCAGCCRPLLSDRPRYVCPACRCAFCDPCDAVIHETLHNCPGCA